MSLELSLILILTLKHFVVDFLWQPQYEWQNKGTYGHWGGIRHSLKHALISFGLLVLFSAVWASTVNYGVKPYYFDAIICVAFLEFIVHYHMDWFKMDFNKRKGWQAHTHPEFWYLMGFDQLIHSLTYIAMVWLLCSGEAHQIMKFIAGM